MPHDDDYEDDEDEEQQDDEEEDSPSNVFFSQALGRQGSDQVHEVVVEVCEEFDLAVFRAHQDEIPGSNTIEDVVDALIDQSDLAIIDLTHERQSVAHEVAQCDGVVDRACVLLIAKKDTPRYGNIQSRMVCYYNDLDELRRILKKQLPIMIDAWRDLPVDEDDDEDEDEDA